MRLSTCMKDSLFNRNKASTLKRSFPCRDSPARWKISVFLNLSLNLLRKWMIFRSSKWRRRKSSNNFKLESYLLLGSSSRDIRVLISSRRTIVRYISILLSKIWRSCLENMRTVNFKNQIWRNFLKKGPRSRNYLIIIRGFGLVRKRIRLKRVLSRWRKSRCWGRKQYTARRRSQLRRNSVW